MRKLRRDVKNRQGQALVEFALILPVFVLLMAGILEFGLFFNSYINVSFASKEGARIASLDVNATDQSVALSVKATMPSSAAVTVTVNPPAPRVTGTLVAVTVSTAHTFTTPIISSVVPSNPYTISAITSMRSE